jgi:hypothetical protein
LLLSIPSDRWLAVGEFRQQALRYLIFVSIPGQAFRVAITLTLLRFPAIVILPYRVILPRMTSANSIEASLRYSIAGR